MRLKPITMFQKLEMLVKHPYAAPIVETVKGISRIAYAPVSGFFQDAKRGWDRAEDNSSRILGIYKGIFDGYNDGSGFIGFVGSLLSAASLAIAGGTAVASGGGGIAAIVGASVAGVGVGAAVGPFVAAGVIMLAAASIGSVIGGVPGLVHGVSKVIDYRKNRAAYDQALQMLPQKSADEKLARRIAPALAAFNELSRDDREPFVRALNDSYENAVYGRSEKIMKSVETLPESERKGLARKLKETLSAEFDDVAIAVSLPTASESEPEDDSVIVAPRTASFSRRSRKTALTA